MKEKDEFYTRFKEEFDFLRSEYGCKYIKREKCNHYYLLFYANGTTGVRVYYEFRKGYVFIFLYRLKDGVIVEDDHRSKDVDDNATFNCYDIDFIVHLRDPSAPTGPFYYRPAPWEEDPSLSFLDYFTNKLKKYAGNVLSGDFSVFEELHPIYREQLKKLREEEYKTKVNN